MQLQTKFSKEFILTLSLMAFWASFEYGYFSGLRDVTPAAYSLNNPVLQSADKLNKLMNNAASSIANCSEFQRTHKDKLADVIRFGTVGFTYNAGTKAPYKGILAATLKGRRVIVLTPMFFALPDAQQETVLGHELLHMIGIPSSLLHNTEYVNRNKDEVYRLTYACFAEIP